MRVGVDGTSWTNRRGYGRFTRNVVRALVARGDAPVTILVDPETAHGGDLPAGAAVVEARLGPPATEAEPVRSRRATADLYRLGRAASKLDVDVFLFPSVYTWYPVLGRRTVVGVHDVIADEFPDLTLPTRAARSRWRLKRSVAVRRAHRVFTVSEASRTAVASTFGIPAAEIVVVPEAPDPVFGPRADEAVDAARHDIGLEAGEPYLVYAGGISPHKGLATLVGAFAELPAGRPRLVVVGALEDEEYLSAASEVREQIRELGLEREVVLSGHVPDETLARLYAGAVAFVSPSTAEGFGLPAVEAAVSATAVVLSDIPAHRESLGGAAVLVPPGDKAALARELESLLEDHGHRNHVAQACASRVASLSWAAAADALHGVLVEAARG